MVARSVVVGGGGAHTSTSEAGAKNGYGEIAYFVRKVKGFFSRPFFKDPLRNALFVKGPLFQDPLSMDTFERHQLSAHSSLTTLPGYSSFAEGRGLSV